VEEPVFLAAHAGKVVALARLMAAAARALIVVAAPAVRARLVLLLWSFKHEKSINFS
jgi:hypothetical protein